MDRFPVILSRRMPVTKKHVGTWRHPIFRGGHIPSQKSFVTASRPENVFSLAPHSCVILPDG
jgi:hypothetical protein